MLNDLKHLNFENSSDSEIKIWRAENLPIIESLAKEIQHLIIEEDVSRQKSSQRLATIQEKVSELYSCASLHDKERIVNQSKITSIIDGNITKFNQSNQVAEDDYDLILDLISGLLKYRLNPAKHSKLLYSDLGGLGPHRLSILERMMVQFNRGISAYRQIYRESRRTEGIASAISLLRKATGTPGKENPYIITELDWNNRDHSRACLYKLNPTWNYLSIKGL